MVCFNGCMSLRVDWMRESRPCSFYHKMIQELNKLYTDYDNASMINMFRNKIDIYLMRANYTKMTFLDSS